MKALKSIKYFYISVVLLSFAILIAPSMAQEYDDMYFNKSDRKTSKIEKADVFSDNGNASINSNYKKITESTETYSSKNINPEYIARYKSSEANEVNDRSLQNKSYSSDDYFVEGYDRNSYVGDTSNKIDYAALAMRDKMSYSNYNRSYASPSWRFRPYMNMGMGFGYPYGFGYDPFMMGYGPMMSMGFGFGFGSGYGFSPMSYNLAMSYGTGYNPWGGWGGYPGYYNPYRMSGFYDPWGMPMYGYNPYFRNYYYGGFSPAVIAVANSGSIYDQGRRIEYKPRTTRSSVSSVRTDRNVENTRIASSEERVRVPSRAVSTSGARTSRDYSKVQNEYYSRARRNSSSTQRISTSSATRSRYSRNIKNTSSSSRFNSISSNKPSRSTTGLSSGNSRSYSGRSSYSGNSNGVRRSSSSSSFSSPSRSSFSGGSRSSSYSSGSSGRSSSGASYGSRSSGSSRSGRQ